MTKADELRALRLLIDEMGADIIINRRTLPTLSRAQRLTARNDLEDAARDWHLMNTGTSAQCTAHPDPEHDPIMPLWSPYHLERPGRVAVVSPCPTWEAHKHGELGWSRAERLLSEHLRHAGIGRDMVSWLCACWCWPSAGEKDNRPPANAELDAWHPWLVKAVAAADVEYVLLHGAHAVRAWRPDLKVTATSGGIFLWQDRWLVTPIPHASAVLRQDGLPVNDWKRDVARFAGAVLEGAGLEAFSDKCIMCDRALYTWDGDGVPWCSEHFTKFNNRQQRARDKAASNKRHQQGGLI